MSEHPTRSSRPWRARLRRSLALILVALACLANNECLGSLPGDADGDGLSDDDEITLGTNRFDADTDGDGLYDGDEVALGTNPLVADGDGDGLLDGAEVLALGTDPHATTTVDFAVDVEPDPAVTMTVAPEIDTPPGDPGLSVRSVLRWKDIPYAQAPTGALRFAPPAQPANVGRTVLVDVDAGDHDGDEDTSELLRDYACMQRPTPLSPPSLTWYLTEDCLRLDVTAPLAAMHPRDGPNPPPLLPVLVWIHGGGWTEGSKNGEDWVELVRETGTIVVSINYRLGALGFFARMGLEEADGSTESFSGNQGLRDQIAALRWVQDQITLFGGDPARVTIFGTSAGGTSVMALVASGESFMLDASGAIDPTRPLFDRAIAQSPGVADLLPGLAEGSELFVSGYARGQSISEALDCDKPTPAEELACLRTDRSEDAFVSSAVMDGNPWPVLVDGPQFLPVVDDDVIVAQPAVALGEHRRVPMIIGTTTHETNLFFNSAPNPTIASGVELVDELQSVAEMAPHAMALAPFYTPSSFDPAPNVTADYNRGATLARARVYSDLLFHCPALKAASGFEGTAPAYVYHLGFTQRRQVTWIPAADESECTAAGLYEPVEDCSFDSLVQSCVEPTDGLQWLCVGAPFPDWECGTPVLDDWTDHSIERSYLTGGLGASQTCELSPPQQDLSNALQFVWGEFAKAEDAADFAPLGIHWPPYQADPSSFGPDETWEYGAGFRTVDWIRRSEAGGVEGEFLQWQDVDGALSHLGQLRCDQIEERFHPEEEEEE